MRLSSFHPLYIRPKEGLEEVDKGWSMKSPRQERNFDVHIHFIHERGMKCGGNIKWIMLLD